MAANHAHRSAAHHGKNFQGPNKVTPENPIQHLEKGSIMFGVLRKNSSNTSGGSSTSSSTTSSSSSNSSSSSSKSRRRSSSSSKRSSKRSRSRSSGSSSSSRLCFLNIACRVYCNGRYRSWLVHKNQNRIMARLGYDLIFIWCSFWLPEISCKLQEMTWRESSVSQPGSVLQRAQSIPWGNALQKPLKQRFSLCDNEFWYKVQKTCFPFVVVHWNKLLTYLAEINLFESSSEKSWSAWLGV